MLGNAQLALVNALLTGAITLSVITGYRAIRRKDVLRHRRWMLGAFGGSCLFLGSFVARIILHGLTPFRGHGAWRVLYFCVFALHDGMAVISIPLILVTLFLGLRASERAHREIARVTLPVWLFVTATGLVLYGMLYL